MRKLLKMIGMQLIQNLWNLRFGLSVILCTFVCMLPTITYHNEMMESYSNSVLKYFIMGGFENVAMESTAFSSEEIMVNFLNSPWFPMLLLLICAFPAVSLFADEYYSGTLYFTLPRTSVDSYSFAKFVAAILSGSMVFACGFGIYALLIKMRFPDINRYTAEMIQDYQMMYGNTNLLYFIGVMLHVMLVAAIYVSIVLLLSTFLKDRYFLFGLPMLVVFFVERLAMYAGSVHVEIYNEGCGWWRLLVPAEYPGIFQDFQWRMGLPYPFFIVIALVEIAVMFLVFRRRIGKRVRRNG